MKQPIWLKIFIILIVYAGQLAYSKGLAAHRARCPCTNVHIYAEKQSDITVVCEVLTETISFMVEAGLDIQDTFDIHLIERLEGFPQQNLYLGVYKQQINEIHILSYESCKRRCLNDCCCGIELTRKLHTSLIVHETAHALTVNLLENKTGCIAAAEYIAYTTQFSLMPADLRQRILADITNEGFVNDVEITSLFHDLSPSVFAVKAYKHFIRPENGKMFYKKLTSEQYILDRED